MELCEFATKNGATGNVGNGKRDRNGKWNRKWEWEMGMGNSKICDNEFSTVETANCEHIQ